MIVSDINICKKSMDKTYSTDFKLWTDQITQLIQQHRWQEIDQENLVNLIEEIQSLGKSERRAIASQLIRLLLHLLKWQYQIQRRSDSWLDSIADARTQIELTIKDSPSLKNYAASQLAEIYEIARRQAAKQTNLAIATFPELCSYEIAEILDQDWLPS